MTAIYSSSIGLLLLNAILISSFLKSFHQITYIAKARSDNSSTVLKDGNARAILNIDLEFCTSQKELGLGSQNSYSGLKYKGH